VVCVQSGAAIGHEKQPPAFWPLNTSKRQRPAAKVKNAFSKRSPNATPGSAFVGIADAYLTNGLAENFIGDNYRSEDFYVNAVTSSGP
jgi:hypothetical protein